MGQIADILRITLQVLQPIAVAENAGTAVIARSLHDMWTQAYMATNRPNVIIAYVGEEARGPFETAAATHRADLMFNVAVLRGSGLTSVRGLSLTDRVGNSDAFYNLVEKFRDAIRSILNISVEQYVDFRNIKPMENAPDEYGNMVDGVLLEFSCAQDYPQLSSVPDNQLPQ